MPDRIVAVGDLHGDLDNAIAVFHLAGLTDEEGHWTGGETVLVQTGDTTDRGPDSKTVMDLMKQLVSEAEAAGGRVVPLLGNHEVMNLHGDWRYVHPGDVAMFGGEESRRKAFSFDGEYGSWLVERDVVTMQGDTVFVHGGVAPQWAEKGLDAINDAARKAIRDAARSPILGPTGPLWYRDFVNQDEKSACPALEKSLETLGAKRMVVGHTTRRDGKIQVRCDGRLHVIDVGIADAYGGNLAAWEWVKGDARAIYASGPLDLEDPQP